MPGSLDTTNTMLAIIAGVAVLQGLLLLGLGFAGWKIYRLATDTIREIDERRVKPLAAKVDGLVDRAHQLTDKVHGLTDRVQQRASRVEAAIDDTVGRVSHTATDVKSNVTDTVTRVSHAVSGLRAALVNALTTEEREPRGNGHAQHSRTVHDPATGAHLHLHTDKTRAVREGGF